MAIEGKGLLTPVQRKFMAAFAQIPDQRQFYLAGGTALAEFYLGHRLSFDLDFFTSESALVMPVSYQIEQIVSHMDLEIEVVRRFSTYVEYLVVDGTEKLKVDLALDSPFRFDAPVLTSGDIQVSGWRDLEIDKLLAYYGRAEPRDAIDLYFILQSQSLDELIALAAQKDPGFDLYWFAIALNRATAFPDELERWPVKMLERIDPVALKQEFRQIAVELMARSSGS